MKNFSIIAAVDQEMGIGRAGQLPWHLSEDLKYFSRITKTTESPSLQNAVIMGRNTWESLPARFKPLPGRFNAVLSSNSELDLPEGVLQFISLDDALSALATSNLIDQVFVIGGARLYADAILHPNLERIYLTRIEEEFDCDTFFPEHIPADFEVVSSTETLEEEGIEFSFVILERKADLDEENLDDSEEDINDEDEISADPDDEENSLD